MKFITAFLTSLTLLVSPSFAGLNQMADAKEWLGYFVGWESSTLDYGISAKKGEGVIHYKKEKDSSLRHPSTGGTGHFKFSLIVQEKKGEKWVNRPINDEVEISSADEMGVNSRKPIKILYTFADGLEVALIHSVSGRKILLKPEIVSKGKAGDLRVGVSINVNKLGHNIDVKKEDFHEELGKVALNVKRVDNKKIKVKYKEAVSLSSPDYFADGASEVKFETKKHPRDLMLKAGDPSIGKITFQNSGYLHKGFKMNWVAEESEVGDSKSYLELRFK